MFTNTSKICIFGISGTGKSYLCRSLQPYFDNLFIFDTLHEYDEQNVFYDYESFSQFVIDTENLNGVKALVRFSIEEVKSTEIFDECIKILYYRGNCTVVIEEVQNFASVHKLPEFLKQASLTGRHQELSFITTTQRVAEIHKSILSQASDIIVGFTQNPNDLKTLYDYGFDVEQIQSLPDRQFIWKQGRDFYHIDNDLNFL